MKMNYTNRASCLYTTSCSSTLVRTEEQLQLANEIGGTQSARCDWCGSGGAVLVTPDQLQILLLHGG